DYRGTACFGFYVLYRTLVRAKVRAIKAAQANAPAAERVAPYLALARRPMQPHPQRLVLTYRLSGRGTTTVAGALICRPTAPRRRSDLERKRLAGVDPLAREAVGVGEGRYDPAATEAAYAALVASADSALSGGLDVIVDAAFLIGERRRAFAPIAARHGARLV